MRRLAYGEIRRIAVGDSMNQGMRRLVVETSEMPLVAELGRVGDLIRLVNVAANHGVAIGYLKDPG